MNTHTSREEQALNELLSNECMPEGLSQATMARIRAAREAEARPTKETVPAHEAEAHSPVHQDWRVLDGAPSSSSPVRIAPVRKTPARPTRRHFVQLMAACLAVGCAGAATFAFAHETAQVGLGEAARVQLGLNRWGTVVRVSCADANLQQAVQDLGLFGLPYEDALARLMEDEAVLSELSGAEGLLVVVESPNQSQEQDVLSGCRRVAEGASCKAMCRSARQGAGAGMGGGHGQGHGSGAGNGRGQGNGRGNGGSGDAECGNGSDVGTGFGWGAGAAQGYAHNQSDASAD